MFYNNSKRAGKIKGIPFYIQHRCKLFIYLYSQPENPNYMYYSTLCVFDVKV